MRGGLALAVNPRGVMLAGHHGRGRRVGDLHVGLISLPIMLQATAKTAGLASGVIAASGTLAQIILPSLVLIAGRPQLGKQSVGDTYKGAFVPGRAGGPVMLWVIALAIFKP